MVDYELSFVEKLKMDASGVLGESPEEARSVVLPESLCLVIYNQRYNNDIDSYSMEINLLPDLEKVTQS